MKKIVLLTLCLLIFSEIFSQKENQITAETGISYVTAYLTGAEITREKKLNLQTGRNLIVFTGLSSKLDPKSIRISSSEPIDILGISHKIDYLIKKEDQPKIKQLKDSLELLKVKITSLSDEQNSFSTEKVMLEKNMQIGGANNGVTVNELKLAADFYRTRIKDINDKISDLSRKIVLMRDSESRITRELTQLNALCMIPRAEIEILVFSDKNINTILELKYLVGDAGWAPSYDIKTEDVSKPIELIYRGKVFNNTGIDWPEVKLVLSTADPSVSVTKPVLSAWYLNYDTYTYNNFANMDKEGYKMNVYSKNQEIQYKKDMNEMDFQNTGGYTEVEVPDLNAEFEIAKKYTIPADDKPYSVDISLSQLNADYKHYAVTKMDKDVFLLARISGWQDLNLVEGPANVYYGGTYVGQSYIYTRNVKDTLDLSLGRDRKVLVTRTKVKGYKDRQLIGNKIIETFDFELVARNNRKSAIEIEVFDQIPISQTDEIEVKVEQLSGGKLTPATGEVKWNIKLEPGQTQKIRLTFTVKYPKNKPIQTQTLKRKQMRMF